MRNSEEFKQEVWRRIEQKRRTRRRKHRVIGMVSGAAVLCGMVALCFVLPGGVSFPQYAAAGAGAAASPQSITIGGYLLVAVAAFALGAIAMWFFTRRNKGEPPAE